MNNLAENRPGWLWSLLEIMTKLDNEAILAGYKLVVKLHAIWAHRPSKEEKFAQSQFDFIVDELTRMRNALIGADLSVSAGYCERLILAMGDSEARLNGERALVRLPLSIAQEYLQRLTIFLPDEANSKVFIAVSSANSKLYEPTSPPFGADVDRVFMVAVEDIRSAGRCLSLELGTATVFHLMRVLEAGFRSVAREVGVAYAPSWESYERKIKLFLESANYNNLTEAQRAKRPFYDQVLEDINTIKLLWRNPTMHIVKSYDANQARLIYGAVEGFMRHLAANLDPIEQHVISTGQSG